jgi:hypothetical protein
MHTPIPRWVHMRCRMTASLRTTATVALRSPLRLASLIPQAFSADHLAIFPLGHRSVPSMRAPEWTRGKAEQFRPMMGLCCPKPYRSCCPCRASDGSALCRSYRAALPSAILALDQQAKFAIALLSKYFDQLSFLLGYVHYFLLHLYPRSRSRLRLPSPDGIGDQPRKEDKQSATRVLWTRSPPGSE